MAFENEIFLENKNEGSSWFVMHVSLNLEAICIKTIIWTFHQETISQSQLYICQ